jgi:hypothetical protein
MTVERPAPYANNPTFAGLLKDKQDSILAGVAKVRAEYKSDVALFDYERRTKAKDRIQSAARKLFDAMDDRACLAAVAEVLMNGAVDARKLKETLQRLVDGPWTIYPEAAYHPAFDWDSPTDSRRPQLGSLLEAEAVRALAALLKSVDVNVSSYVGNPGFILLRELAADVFPDKLSERTIQRALAG